MKVDIVSKNFRVFENFEEIVKKKLERLDKYFEKSVKAKVLCRQEKDTYVLELTIFADVILRAEVRNNDDMYANIDAAISKLARQINKHKTRLDAKFLKDFNKEKEFLFAGEAAEKNSAVVKKKRYDLLPMTLDEAMVEIDLIGHDFYVFLDSVSGLVNILYRRKDGDFGVIEAHPAG